MKVEYILLFFAAIAWGALGVGIFAMGFGPNAGSADMLMGVALGALWAALPFYGMALHKIVTRP